jgi:hypothetical protein
MKSWVIWDITPCSLLKASHVLEEHVAMSSGSNKSQERGQHEAGSKQFMLVSCLGLIQKMGRNMFLRNVG